MAHRDGAQLRQVQLVKVEPGSCSVNFDGFLQGTVW